MAAPHILRTLAGVDIQSVQELEGVTEAPPTGWVESHGNLTVARPGRVVVAMGAGNEGAFQSRGREAVDNTEALEVAGVS